MEIVGRTTMVRSMRTRPKCMTLHRVVNLDTTCEENSEPISTLLGLIDVPINKRIPVALHPQSGCKHPRKYTRLVNHKLATCIHPLGFSIGCNFRLELLQQIHHLIHLFLLEASLLVVILQLFLQLLDLLFLVLI